MTVKCDVLVIGAGPAGSSAAHSAALRGKKTILIEKKECVGVPVKCAEGIGTYLFPYMPFSIPKNQLKWYIEGISFWVDSISLERRGKLWKGYTIDRADFDRWLSKIAVKAGAVLSTNTELVDLKLDKEKKVKTAIIKNQNKEIKVNPKVVIGADGSESTTLRLLGLYNPKKGDIAEVYSWEVSGIDLHKEHFEQIYVGNFAPGGYGYIFPKSNTTANIGVGASYHKKNIEAYFNRFLDLDLVSEQVDNCKFLLEKSKKVIWSDIIDDWIYGNTLLVGDAANHNLKPFIEGILPAVIGGNIAGITAVDMCNKKRAYAESYYKEFSKALYPHFEFSKEVSELSKRFFSMKHKKKDLLFSSMAMQLFELEKIIELERMSYEELRLKFIERTRDITKKR